MYDVLLLSNKYRGTFSYGHCIYGKNTPAFHVKRIKDLPAEKDINDLDTNILYLGHCQSPTGRGREWSENTSHPFISGNWIVAHNGVINNFKVLKAAICPADTKIQVDSNIIPVLLNAAEVKGESDLVNNIKTVVEQLQGTVTCWIAHTASKRIFLIRQGTTLFANKKTGSFCSAECKSEDWEELEEGKIYEINHKQKKINEVGSFKQSSPFLFL
jgi:glucosamine 6-phosphate synthetase-like amidotransferase/phosphosugar isomerase protein